MGSLVGPVADGRRPHIRYTRWFNIPLNYDLYSVSDLIINLGEDMTSDILSGFRCSMDSDREAYLHEKAVMMEKKAMSRTYVALTEDDDVVGYFSVGMKCVAVPRTSPYPTA